MNEALLLWRQKLYISTQETAKDESFIKLVESLVLADKNSTSYKEVLQKVRNSLEVTIAKNNFRGFFLISKDFKNIGSMRDTNLLKTNLIHEQYPELLKAAFEGQTKFVPTLYSDVSLVKGKEGSNSVNEQSATSFVITPIVAKDGNIIAVLAFRIAPLEEYARICKIGRLGKSGETYAFSEKGFLLTESRFKKTLVDIGLIENENSEILNVQIRDPKVDLLKSSKKLTSQDGLDLTFMASSAIQGQSGVNTGGYRDYRGVMVYGAWLWDKNLNLGLTTEIDAIEADEPTILLREAFVWVSIILFIVFLLITFIISKLNRVIRDKLVEMNLDLEARVKAKTIELQKTNEAKEKFFALIAHDLRGPIGIVSSILSEIKNENISLDSKVLDMLVVSTSSSFSLLEDLLIWAFQQEATEKINKIKFDFQATLDEMQIFYKALLSTKQIELVYENNSANLITYCDGRLA